MSCLYRLEVDRSKLAIDIESSDVFIHLVSQVNDLLDLLTHEPRVAQLLLFPDYLRHQVQFNDQITSEECSLLSLLNELLDCGLNGLLDLRDLLIPLIDYALEVPLGLGELLLLNLVLLAVLDTASSEASILILVLGELKMHCIHV